MESALIGARNRHRHQRVKWGFVWAIWCAILWGAWYVPGSAIWFEAPFSGLSFDAPAQFLTAVAIITAFNAVTVLLFLFLWIAVLGKLGDYWRTLCQRKVRNLYFLAAIFGGFGAFGTFLAIAYIGGVFAAVSVLLYPVVGATLSRLWYREKITARVASGIFVIIAGGVTVYVPGILGELSGAGPGAWLGYVGGAMAAFGWGIEGAIAGRVLDVSDPDVGSTIRFTAEAFYLVVLVVPAIGLFTDQPAGQIVVATFSFWPITWLLLAGISFGFSYTAWYKSFPLIGVGRGQAIGALYGVFAVLFLALFTLDIPDWNFLVGLVLTIGGIFIMYTEGDDILEVVRESLKESG